MVGAFEFDDPDFCAKTGVQSEAARIKGRSFFICVVLGV
jgi:hypothetical protein